MVRIGNCQFFPRAPKPAYPSQVNAPRAWWNWYFGQNWQLPIFPTGSEAGLSPSGQRSASVVELVFWSELAIANFSDGLRSRLIPVRSTLRERGGIEYFGQNWQLPIFPTGSEADLPQSGQRSASPGRIRYFGQNWQLPIFPMGSEADLSQSGQRSANVVELVFWSELAIANFSDGLRSRLIPVRSTLRERGGIEYFGQNWQLPIFPTGSEAGLFQPGQRSASPAEAEIWSELAIANFSHGLRSRLIPVRSTLRERGGISILVRIGNCQFFPRAPKPAYPSQINAPRAWWNWYFGQNWQLPIFPTGSEAGLPQPGQRSASPAEAEIWSELAIANFSDGLRSRLIPVRSTLRERGGISILVRIGNCQFFPRAPKPAYSSQVNAPRARPRLKFGQNWQLPIFPMGSEADLSQSGQRSASVVELVFWSELAIANFSHGLRSRLTPARSTLRERGGIRYFGQNWQLPIFPTGSEAGLPQPGQRSASPAEAEIWSELAIANFSHGLRSRLIPVRSTLRERGGIGILVRIGNCRFWSCPDNAANAAQEAAPTLCV